VDIIYAHRTWKLVKHLFTPLVIDFDFTWKCFCVDLNRDYVVHALLDENIGVIPNLFCVTCLRSTLMPFGFFKFENIHFFVFWVLILLD